MKGRASGTASLRSGQLNHERSTDRSFAIAIPLTIVYMLSDLSNIFGAPGTGIHSVRLGGLAIVDVVLSLVLSLCITLGTGQNMTQISLCVFLAGIALHRLFNVKTTIDRAIFG